MEVNFSFDKVVIAQKGFTLTDVYWTIKSLFAAHGFPCVSDGSILAFKDKGHGDDFATMWEIILSLLRSDWFMECVISCVWQDGDNIEDVLVQAGKERDTVRK